jgi:hypothetical protein
MRFCKNTLVGQAALLATLLTGLAVQKASAGFPLGNSVTMGGEPVFSIKSPAYGYTAEHRAQMAQDNLDNALATAPACSASMVKSERINGSPSLVMNGHLVATADFASADQENLTPEQLAEKWADNVRSFLADQEKSQSYRNSLIGLHPIQASIAYVERRLFAPEGTTLRVVFDRVLSSNTLRLGDVVYGTVAEDVPVGHFVIPEGSVVTGKVMELETNRKVVSFTELKTPNGTECPINASIANTYFVVSDKPHPVCTLSMPAGLNTDARVPAMIAIGAPTEKTEERLAFVPGSQFEIAPGQEVSVILNEVTPVALIDKNMAM